jgi:hypothetical protein
VDFYNNVAAIASVLMFAKLVTHRTRKARDRNEILLVSFHTAAVVASAGAIAVSLIATADGSADLRWLAWWLLGASGSILIVDVLVDDWAYAKQR